MTLFETLSGRGEGPSSHDWSARPARPVPARDAGVQLDHETLLENGIFGFEQLDAHSRSFVLLRSQLLHRFHRSGGRVLAVTSTQPGNGKTYITANVAASLSRIQPTVLIDLDLRRPTLAGRFGLAPTWGVDDHLAGKIGWAATGTKIAGVDLTIHGARAPRADSATLLASPVLANVFAAIRADPAEPICIVDTPPVLVLDDIMLIARNVDGILMIVEEGNTRGADIAQALRILGPTPVIGSVLNKSMTVRSSVRLGGYYDAAA